RAEQLQPVKRHVALKIIKPGMDSRQVIARFEAERQALALMDHPNIARVLDGGTVGDAGRPYFVMQLVQGLPVTQFCLERGLSVPERLELFAAICHAVQHAHQKGVIHRDLKPSNVLVVLESGRPAPKVIDFGIAKAIDQKLTDQTLHTHHGVLVGTLEYMSPEQADLSPAGIDTRSDIYALGVLLYELLTGTTPLDKERLKSADFDEVRRIIREEEPETVSKRLARTRRVGSAHQSSSAVVSKSHPGGHSPPYRLSELDWIVARCLEKDRNRRYESASALALDLERYLANEPVSAVPPSAGYRLRKFARRNRGALAVAAGLLLAVTVIAACVGWTVRDRIAQQALQEQAEAARLATVASQVRESLQAARALVAESKVPLAREKLAQAKAQLGNDGTSLASLAAPALAGAAELDRWQHFLDLIDLAHQAETSPPELSLSRSDLSGSSTADSRKAKAAALRALALQSYRILEQPDWKGQLAGGFLEQPQIEQIGRLAYESLLWLANDALGRQKEIPSEASLTPSAAARMAQTYLDRAASSYRPTQALYVLRARCHVVLGDEAAAQSDQALAAGTAPSVAVDHFLHGLQAEGGRRLAEAVQAYQQALRLEPNHYWSMMQLGSCLADLGQGPADFREAAGVFTGCILNRPDHAHAYRCRANAWIKLRRLPDALADNTQAIRLDPQSTKAWHNRGVTYRFLGQPDKALADFSKVIELDPRDAKAWNNRGDVFRVLGRLDEAAQNFTRAIELVPQYVLALTNRGLTNAQLGRREEAEADFARALEQDPKSKIAWYGRGSAYLEWKHPDKALADFSQAIELDPRFVDAWNNRGIAHKQLNQPAKALADYSRAVELDPSHAKAWYNRGNTYSLVRQWEHAVADFSKAIELDPKYAAALHYRGVAYLKLSKFEQALPDCKRSVELAPTERFYWQSLGVAHYRTGDWQAAAGALDMAVELSRGGQATDWLYLAMARQKLGQADAARQAFARAQEWLDQNKAALAMDEGLADELRQARLEAEEALEMKPK
ncbi:MAG TPA: tetratricopeptide repeat protein, partial [Pirellulaceae bacterium]|nr:tetratricopeptide repeat protein [Pirellulaceae bacterium]